MDEAPPDWGVPVRYWPPQPSDDPAIPFLPDRVIGTELKGLQPNGDFMISHADVLGWNLNALRRHTPR